MPPQQQSPEGKSEVAERWKKSASLHAFLITTSICLASICWIKRFHTIPSPERPSSGPKRFSCTWWRSVFTMPLCCTRQRAAERSTILCTNSCSKSSVSLTEHKEPNAAVDDNDDTDTPIASKQPRHDPADRLAGGLKRHKIAIFPPSPAKQSPNKACRVCRKRGRRHDTRYCCVHCGVTLCAVPCFNDYHSKQYY